jgi:hypothetical protein
MKNTFIRSGKSIDAKMTSVGKKAASKDEVKAVFVFFVISAVILKTRRIFMIENRNGKKSVANSFEPNIIIEKAFKPIKASRNGNIG